MAGIERRGSGTLTRLDHIRQSVAVILTTRIGTRVMRRDFGSRIYDLIDAPMNEAIKLELYAATAEALSLWEPRVTVTQVEVQSASPGHLTLGLEMLDKLNEQALRLDGIIIT